MVPCYCIQLEGTAPNYYTKRVMSANVQVEAISFELDRSASEGCDGGGTVVVITRVGCSTTVVRRRIALAKLNASEKTSSDGCA